MSYIKPQQLVYVVNAAIQEAFFATNEWASSYALNWPDCQVIMSYAGVVPTGYEMRKFETTRILFVDGLVNTVGAL